jgi:hypothetical protein
MFCCAHFTLAPCLNRTRVALTFLSNLPRVGGLLTKARSGGAMQTAVASGDVFIRPYVGGSFQLVDASTREQIAIVPSMETALSLGTERGGAVWQENADNRGRVLGPPILLLPRGSIEVPTHPAPRMIRRGDQVQQLEALRQKWTAELQQLVSADTDRAFHLAQALDDLAVLIDRLENKGGPVG